MRRGVALVVILLAVAACSANGPAVAHSSPSTQPSSPSSTTTPTLPASPSASSSPSASPLPTPATVAVPAWAALHATCTGTFAAHEAVLRIQGQSNLVIADVTNAANPKPICTLTGNPPGGGFSPQLVTQTLISWYSSQAAASGPAQSVIAVLDLTTSTSFVVASWSAATTEGLDGLHAWSPDRGYLAYVTSTDTAFNLHLLSDGGDQVVATYGAVVGRGANPNEDDGYLAFSPDGAYFALVETITSSGDQLQVRRVRDGGLAYSLPTGTMATWGSLGSRLFFRRPGATAVDVWNSTGGVSLAFGQPLAWIRPRAAAGDDNIAFTVRDPSGKPHVWLFGHNGRSGGELPNIRSSPAWLNTTAFFYVEESLCTTSCPLGPSWQPDGKTFTFDTATQSETASKIGIVFSSWPSPGQA